MKLYSRNKNSTKIFIATTLVAAAIFFASNYFLNKSNQVVIAKVNDQKIFKSDVESKLHSLFDEQNQGVKVPEVQNLPKEVLEFMVKEIYIEKELTKLAKKSKATQTKEIEAQIAATKDKILRQAYLDSLLKTEITDKRINEKYVEISNEISGKNEYLVSHIVVDSKEEAELLLKELKSKKANSGTFAELAKKYSVDSETSEKGGSLGYLLEDNMIKEIAEAVIKLKKDDISTPIQTKFGWHLVKVSDTKTANVMPFEIIKDSIREQLKKEKIEEINSKIAKNTKVQILIELKKAEAVEEKEKSLTESSENDSESTAQPKTEETKSETTKPEEVKDQEGVSLEKKSETNLEKDGKEKPDAKNSKEKKSQQNKR